MSQKCHNVGYFAFRVAKNTHFYVVFATKPLFSDFRKKAKRRTIAQNCRNRRKTARVRPPFPLAFLPVGWFLKKPLARNFCHTVAALFPPVCRPPALPTPFPTAAKGGGGKTLRFRKKVVENLPYSTSVNVGKNLRKTLPQFGFSGSPLCPNATNFCLRVGFVENCLPVIFAVRFSSVCRLPALPTLLPTAAKRGRES